MTCRHIIDAQHTWTYVQPMTESLVLTVGGTVYRIPQSVLQASLLPADTIVLSGPSGRFYTLQKSILAQYEITKEEAITALSAFQRSPKIAAAATAVKPLQP
jgi:hypothetical protein